MVQDLYCVQMRVSGYINHYKFVLGAGAIKNRDKLIDPTVRVRYRLFFYYLINYTIDFGCLGERNKVGSFINTFCSINRL